MHIRFLLIWLCIFCLPIHSQSTSSPFAGNWTFESVHDGMLSSLALTLQQTPNGLEGEYYNVSSKESTGKILRATLKGKIAWIEVDCDWGGSGTVKLVRLSGNRLQWQVIKRNTQKGEFIVLARAILHQQTKQVR